MKLESSVVDIHRNGIVGEKSYGINLTSKMYEMLSSKLYTDRIGSVVREVCSNAWDAQKMRSIATGQPMEPFKVTLPTDLEPHFIVEDSGPGMPDDAAQDLYSTLGLSTKENTNDQIGAFGLGSKSPFAVTDTFTVENTYEGVTHHYLCFKAENGLPSLLKTGETKDGRANGVKVMVPAAGSKYLEYKRALNRQLIVMDPKPIICNIEEFNFSTANKVLEIPEGFILGNANDFGLSRGIWARMGMVLYPVDVSQIGLSYGERFHEKLSQNSVLVLEFPIGALEPLPSREGLTYDDRTCSNLIKAYSDFGSSYMSILRKDVEVQPTPLDAWRKIQEVRSTLNMDLTNLKIYNLGFVINNNSFVNDFPYFNHFYTEKKIKFQMPKYDQDGEIIPQPEEYEMIDKVDSVSQFYYEEFTGSDTRLNIKRTPYPMKMNFKTLDDIDKGNTNILIMDELEPKYRIGRMKSVLNAIKRSWGSRYWVIRVDPRYQGSKEDFDEFIKSFEMLHRGITKKFTWFSQVPRPEAEKKKKEDDSPIEGVSLQIYNKKWSDNVRWSEIESGMSPKDVYDPDDEDIPDDYEELCEKAKSDYLSSHFYVLAERNDLTDYPAIPLKSFLDFCKEQKHNCFIVRKTGLNKLKDLKKLGLKEFKEFIDEKLDGHDVGDEYRKYSSAKNIAVDNPFWFGYSNKTNMELLHKHLEEASEFVHPFFKEHELVNRLSTSSIDVSNNPNTQLISSLRVNRLLQYFEGFEWANISEIDISKEFKQLEESFMKYYPAFNILCRALGSHNGLSPTLAQYVNDYNALRGKDVLIEEFEDKVIKQTDEVKETEEDENV